MKKLSGMVMMLVAGMLLGGCYSKSCDTACPASKHAPMKTASANAATTTAQSPTKAG